MLQRLTLAAIGHLLERERWARDRLAPFAGRTIAITLAPFTPFDLVVTGEGRLRASQPGDESPAVNARLERDALAALVRGEPWWERLALVGDAGLAETLRELARHLRWDPADDLARLVGDVPAERIAQAGRDLAAWQRDARGRLSASVAEYVSAEKRLVASRAELDAFTGSVRALSEAIAALDARIAVLERRRVG